MQTEIIVAIIGAIGIILAAIIKRWPQRMKKKENSQPKDKRITNVTHIKQTNNKGNNFCISGTQGNVNIESGDKE